MHSESESDSDSALTGSAPPLIRSVLPAPAMSNVGSFGPGYFSDQDGCQWQFEWCLRQEAERALWPLQWSVLFPEPDDVDDDDDETGPGCVEVDVLQPIKELAKYQWHSLQRLQARLGGAEGESQALSPHSQQIWMDYDFDMLSYCEMIDLEQCYWEEKAVRYERARHYGMMVCHAFFSEPRSESCPPAVVKLARSWKW